MKLFFPWLRLRIALKCAWFRSCYCHLTLSSKQYGKVCFTDTWKGTRDGSIIEGKCTMREENRVKHKCSEESDSLYCPNFAPQPSQGVGLQVTLHQPIIWENSHCLSKRCKQIPEWRLWASWRHYIPGWKQSWSLRGQNICHSPSSGGGLQNHPAERKTRLLKF